MATVATVSDFSYPERFGLFHEHIMKNLIQYVRRLNCALKWAQYGVICYHKEIRQRISLHVIISELLTWNSLIVMVLIRAH